MLTGALQPFRRKQKIAQIARNMPRATVDRDRIPAAAGHVVHDGCRGIELFALLIEVRRQQRSAAINRPCSGFQLAHQELDQRRFAATVGTDDADTITAHDARGEIRDYRSGACGGRRMAGPPKSNARCRASNTSFPDGDASCALRSTCPIAFAPLAALSAQLLEGAHSAFVARAPRFHALANPRFLLRELLVEQRRVPGLDFQRCPLLQHVLVVVAGPSAQLSAIQFEDARREAAHECAVMADKQAARRQTRPSCLRAT